MAQTHYTTACPRLCPTWLQGSRGHQVEAANIRQFHVLLSEKASSLGHRCFLTRDNVRVAPAAFFPEGHPCTLPGSTSFTDTLMSHHGEHSNRDLSAHVSIQQGVSWERPCFLPGSPNLKHRPRGPHSNLPWGRVWRHHNCICMGSRIPQFRTIDKGFR